MERFTIKNIQMKASIFIKLNFRELYDSKLSGLHAFDNMTLTENLPVLTNDFTTLY